MFSSKPYQVWLSILLAYFAAVAASAQSFRVQCPTSTKLHPTADAIEPAYPGPNGVNGAIKCQQISGGDGFATMADGTQTYLFAFGPLSGLQHIQSGLPGTEFGPTFNAIGDPNGVIGLAPDPDAAGAITGHVDPRQILDVGVMNGNIPAPLMAIDEDDEFFLTLTNVGMIMRPDLFEQHTVHFHGYPNASSFYDGVPDASVAINIGGSFTYYYLAPDAGTYFWHCHITPPEHLEMGMVGQLYVRPRQNRVPVGTNLYYAMTGTNTGGAFGTATGPSQQSDLRTACNSNGESNLYAGPTGTTPSADILCSVPSPAANNTVTHVAGYKYVYNDGDGSTRYSVDVPIQMHGFDPSFHFVGMTFNPEGFSDLKDKYFLLNGRSYPDTVGVPAGSAAGWTGGVPGGASNPDPVSNAIFTQG